MRSRFHHLTHLREKNRLDALAREQGWENAETMVKDLYEVKRWSLKRLTIMLQLPTQYLLQQWMKNWGIEIKGRGGRNNLKFDLTPQLVEEVTRDGITAVADRLGISRTRLYTRLQEYLKETKHD